MSDLTKNNSDEERRGAGMDQQGGDAGHQDASVTVPSRDLKDSPSYMVTARDLSPTDGFSGAWNWDDEF